MSQPKHKKFITKEEAAALTGFTPIAIYRKTQKRQIPFYKVGRLIRFDPDELLEWAAKSHIPVEPTL